MTCEYYCKEEGYCRKGMPITRLYEGLICRKKPERCPVHYFSPRYIFECR